VYLANNTLVSQNCRILRPTLFRGPHGSGILHSVVQPVLMMNVFSMTRLQTELMPLIAALSCHIALGWT